MHGRSIANGVALPIAILSFYFLIPIGGGAAPIGGALGLVIAGLCIAAVAWVIMDEARRSDKTLRPIHLIIAFELVWVTFSLTYYVISVNLPDQFVGLETRLDALYFSLTTMSTVGYGDVSAQGQLARLLVTIQLAFNLGFVAAFAAIFQDMVRRSGSRRRLRRLKEEAEHDEHDDAEPAPDGPAAPDEARRAPDAE